MESLSVDIIPAGEPEDTAGAAFPGPGVGGDADAAAMYARNRMPV